ncbi:NUDIX hydrolase [Nocardioides sp.]|uniref:NUDIX hydrolase n=1 Tax=Nocardioides sp. TaxID=35761 RepID=UPI003D0FD4E7
MARLPRRQRVAAYAVILREDEILLSRLAPRVSREELWTLPGGGLDHGEDPHDAVVREIHEETGLDATVSETARLYSAHMPGAWRDGVQVDAHALRIVYEGWVRPDAPQPRVVEVDGSTVEAAWIPIADVLSGARPVVPMVVEALADHQTFKLQRVAAYALIRRPGDVLLTRISALGAHAGQWTLPGGGIAHGEAPADAVAREVKEECGLDCVVGGVVAVHDHHFSGTAPSGRFEDYHGVHLIYAASVDPTAVPEVIEQGGTTDAAAWISVADIESGAVPVLDVVRHAVSGQ